MGGLRASSHTMRFGSRALQSCALVRAVGGSLLSAVRL